MSPFAVQVLRRVALLAAATAALVVGVPWALSWAGLIGPGPQDDIDAAARALSVARSYGAAPGETSFQTGSGELARARDLLAAGRTREARRAAARARALGIEAQRAALGAREGSRRRAQDVVHEIDSLLSGLERLFDQKTRGLGPEEHSRLSSSMKEARQVGGGLFLAFDQGQFDRVLELEGPCREKLRDLRTKLDAVAPPPS